MDAHIPQSAGHHGHLQQIIAGLTEGVILVEPDQTLSWANRAALEMHGATELDELGRTVADYQTRFRLTYSNKHPLAAGDYPVQRVVAGEAFDELVVEVTRLDRPGSRWIHQLRGLVLTGSTKQPELLALVIEDVTERFDAEERFERTFDANPAPAVICRLGDLRYVKVNRGFLEMTGLTRHDVIGQSVYDIDILADAEKREQAVACLREGRTIEQQEACIPVGEGRRKPVIVAGQPIELADKPCMLFTFTDLEPRKRAEDALRHSEQRFATVFRLAPVPMAVSTLDDFIFLDVNDAFARLTGYSNGELVGQCPAELALWESSEARHGLHRDFGKAGSVRNHEIRLRTRSGELLECLVSAERVTILDRPCVLKVLQDITDRKRSETELFAAIEAVMQDTSWFSRKVIEKVADLRQPARTDASSVGVESLTERERQVLGILCTGTGDADIARQFGLSRHTVRNHVSAIYEKIGVHSRSAAVAWARDRGLTARSSSAAPDRTSSLKTK